ncbi:hypothetical protein GCM10020255_074250 [Rhodococcus baikonurensis]
MSDLIASHVDLGAVRALAASNVSSAAWDPVAEIGGHAESRPVVAMAGGPAFTFGYAEHRELLTAAGADVQVFDPLHDELPAGTAALVLPGGFPEEHAVDLAANTVLLQQVRDLADGGAPIHAECAGLLYLARSLDGHGMAGVVGVDATFGKRLTLGYREAVAISDSSLFDAGSRVTGHEFHRTSRLDRRGRLCRRVGMAAVGRRQCPRRICSRRRPRVVSAHSSGGAAPIDREVRRCRSGMTSV